MRRTVGELRREVTAMPLTFVVPTSTRPPAFAGRGAAAHNRRTTSRIARSGVKTIRSVPVTVPPENDTVADSLGRWGSGWAYDVGHALGEGLAAGAVGATPVVTIVVLCVVVVIRDGAAVGDAVVAALLVQAAASAVATTHPVRMARR